MSRAYHHQLPSDHCPYRRLLAAIFVRAAKDYINRSTNPYLRRDAELFLQDPSVQSLLETEFDITDAKKIVNRKSRRPIK